MAYFVKYNGKRYPAESLREAREWESLAKRLGEPVEIISDKVFQIEIRGDRAIKHIAQISGFGKNKVVTEVSSTEFPALYHSGSMIGPA